MASGDATGLPALRESVRAYGRIAASSFGGPAAQVAVIHRVIVEEKGWLTEAAFVRALSFCMLLPGPEAQQLVTWVGWRMHGIRGGLAAGLLFIAPGFAAMLALSILYVAAADVTVISAMLAGLKPAVLPVVLEAVVRLKRRAAGGARGTIIAAVAFVAIFALGVPFPVIVVGAGLAGWLTERRATAIAAGPVSPSLPAGTSVRASARTAATWLAIWFGPVAVVVVLLGAGHTLSTLATFFSKVAVVTFGGAYAILAYVAQEAVGTYRWLTPVEMLDGLGLAETTPGPLIMVVQFVGFLAAFRNPGPMDPMIAGVLGSIVTVWVTFAPSFLFILVGAPWIERMTANRKLAASLAGVTAAVVGVVLNLGLWFAIHTLFSTVTPRAIGPVRVPVPDLTTFSPAVAAIAAIAAVALFRFRLGLLWVLAGGAVLGVAARVAGLI